MGRLKAWRRYRRRLADFTDAHLDKGYRLSPPEYRRLSGLAWALRDVPLRGEGR